MIPYYLPLWDIEIQQLSCMHSQQNQHDTASRQALITCIYVLLCWISLNGGLSKIPSGQLLWLSLRVKKWHCQTKFSSIKPNHLIYAHFLRWHVDPWSYVGYESGLSGWIRCSLSVADAWTVGWSTNSVCPCHTAWACYKYLHRLHIQCYLLSLVINIQAYTSVVMINTVYSNIAVSYIFALAIKPTYGWSLYSTIKLYKKSSAIAQIVTHMMKYMFWLGPVHGKTLLIPGPLDSMYWVCSSLMSRNIIRKQRSLLGIPKQRQFFDIMQVVTLSLSPHIYLHCLSITLWPLPADNVKLMYSPPPKYHNDITLKKIDAHDSSLLYVLHFWIII